MRSRWVSVLLNCVVVLILLIPLAAGQSPVTPIQDAHGGAGFLKNLSGYAISGTLHRPDGTSLPFSLMVQGDNSRFETSEGVSIFNGDVQQWWKTGGHRSQARYSRHGGQEIYLSPFYVATRLDKYQFDGADKTDRFTRKPQAEIPAGNRCGIGDSVQLPGAVRNRRNRGNRGQCSIAGSLGPARFSTSPPSSPLRGIGGAGVSKITPYWTGRAHDRGQLMFRLL